MAGKATSGGTRRWKYGTKTVVAVGVWVGSLAGAAVLYGTTPGFLAFRGVAELVEYHPAARQAERVAGVPVEVGQRVRAGDVVAVLDAGPTARDLEVLAAQLARAEAELESKRIELARASLGDQRRYADAVESAEVALLAARNRQQADRAELDGMQARIRWWAPMVEAKAAPGQTHEDLKEEARVLERRIGLDAEAIRSWEKVLDQSRRRLQDHRATAPGGEEAKAVETGLEPFRLEVEAYKARVSQLKEKLDGLTLRAPGDGVVYKVQVRPGDVAMPGAPVVQIRAQSTRRVMAYVSDVVASMVAPGTPVQVAPRDAAGRRLAGRVLALGSGMRPLPEQALMNPNWREFGEEVVIELDEAGALAPGQVVDVRFDLGDVPPGAAGEGAALAGAL